MKIEKLGDGIKPYVIDKIKEVVWVVQSYFYKFENWMMAKIHVVQAPNLTEIKTDVVTLKKEVKVLIECMVQVVPLPLPYAFNTRSYGGCRIYGPKFLH